MIYGYVRVSCQGQEAAIEKQKKMLSENGAEKIYTDVHGTQKPAWYDECSKGQ